MRHDASRIGRIPDHFEPIENKAWPVIIRVLPRRLKFPPDSGATLVLNSQPGRAIPVQILSYDPNSGDAEIAVEEDPLDATGHLIIDFRWLIRQGKRNLDIGTGANELDGLSLNQLADLFHRDKSVISRHIKNGFDEGEKQVTRDIEFYNLDVIISVGYRVKSLRGTQFRIWATQRLRESIVKGFTMDDERLKQSGSGAYFDELLERIRDIRSSEKVFWRKVLDIMISCGSATGAFSPTRAGSG